MVREVLEKPEQLYLLMDFKPGEFVCSARSRTRECRSEDQGEPSNRSLPAGL